MKNNLIVILTLAIIAITIGLLFAHGGKTINQANNGFTAIGFVNLDNNLNLSKNKFTDLQFFIDNREPQKTTYTIKFHLNDKLIDKQEIKISSKKKELITPTQKVKEKIKAISEKTIKYSVEINWKKGKRIETIEKTIQIKK